MMYTNITTVTDMIITGFPGLLPQYYGLVSALFLLTFLCTVFTNLFIIAFVACERSLHKPSYLIFCHLAMTDLIFGFVTLPKIIARYWWNDMMLSFGACLAQMYFVHSLGAIHSLILLIMAVDRFIAICIPFRYQVLITNNIVTIVNTLLSVFIFINMTIVLYHTVSLPYCDSNIIAHCFCDRITIVSLACKKDAYVDEYAFAFSMFTLLGPLGFIIFSYFAIIIAVLKITSSEGRYRILSTCSPQLFITSLYYLPRCFVYFAYMFGFAFPNANIRLVFIMLYSLLPGAINPIIYALKTKDFKHILINKFKNRKIGIDIKVHYKM